MRGQRPIYLSFYDGIKIVFKNVLIFAKKNLIRNFLKKRFRGRCGESCWSFWSRIFCTGSLETISTAEKLQFITLNWQFEIVPRFINIRLLALIYGRGSFNTFFTIIIKLSKFGWRLEGIIQLVINFSLECPPLGKVRKIVCTV